MVGPRSPTQPPCPSPPSCMRAPRSDVTAMLTFSNRRYQQRHPRTNQTASWRPVYVTIRVTVLSPLLGSAPRAGVLSGFQYLTVPLHLVADNLREAVQTVGEHAEHLSRPTGKIRTAAKPRRTKVPRSTWILNGAALGNRTPDLRITSASLWPTELRRRAVLADGAGVSLPVLWGALAHA